MKVRIQTSAPEALERKIVKAYPDLDGYIEHMTTKQESIVWPKWCYMPMAASIALLSSGAEKVFAVQYIQNMGYTWLYGMSAIVPWKANRNIYRFSGERTAAIQRNAADDFEVGTSAFYDMPQPCVYIETPPGIYECAGVFFFLDWEYAKPEMTELRAHYLFTDGSIEAVSFVWPDNLNRKLLPKVGLETGNINNRLRNCMTHAPLHARMLLHICQNKDVKEDLRGHIKIYRIE